VGKRILTVTAFSRCFDLFFGRTGSLEPLIAKKSSSFSFRDKDTRNLGHWNKSISTFSEGAALSWWALSSVLALIAGRAAGESVGVTEVFSGLTSGLSECTSGIREILASLSRAPFTWLLVFCAVHVAPVPSTSLFTKKRKRISVTKEDKVK